jgi:CRP-like cAMP-binding protein
MTSMKSNILKSSSVLADAVTAIGHRERFACGDKLFELGDENDGVFLVLSGKVGMSVKDVPSLDRTFPRGSLLGLPATILGRPYSLTATAMSDSDVVHLAREEFLQLMRDQLELCREATDMLCRETAFIEGAVAERRRCAMASA